MTEELPKLSIGNDFMHRQSVVVDFLCRHQFSQIELKLSTKDVEGSVL